MAAPTIRSKSTAAFVSFGPKAYIDVTKPTGLTAGDLMVMCIGGESSGASPYFDAPAGWTLLTGFLPASNTKGAAFWKIADSTDAAASVFRFEPKTGTDGTGGIMYAITVGTFHAASPISAYNSDSDSTSSTPTYTCGITPTADNLLIAFIANFESGGGAPSSASLAIGTSNPTWTEDLDQSRNGGGYYYHNASYSAPRTQATGTGNVTVTYSGGGSWYGACLLFGIQPPQTTNYPLTAAVGTFTLTGIAGLLHLGRKLTAALGTFALTSIATGLKFGRKMTAAVGAFTLTYYNITTLFGKILTATTGAFVLTGVAASIRSTRKITADLGVFTFTGVNNIMMYGRRIVAAVGTYTLTLNTVIVTSTRKIVAAVGTFILTGVNVSFPRASKIFANTGVFILSGQDAILRRGKKMTAAVGTFVLTGVSVLFPRASKIFALTGAFTLTGYSARGLVNGLTNFWHASTKHISTWINKLKS